MVYLGHGEVVHYVASVRSRCLDGNSAETVLISHDDVEGAF